MSGDSYKRYVLILLTAILAFNYIDRFALGVLMQDIKADLRLNDTQLGFLTGIAFAGFYAVMGIPIARWADRGNRVHIISLTLALWGGAVAACGAAQNFTQLVLLRMGVAVGEAGGYPPALSLISDLFERAERPRAVSRFLLGAPIALTVGYFAAGWLDQYFGWRITFAVIGLSGAPLALLAIMSLKEPRALSRKGTFAKRSLTLDEPVPNLREVIVGLWRNTAFRNLFFSFSVWGFFGYGIMQWLPAFFTRSYGLSGGALGTWLAGVDGIAGLVGTWLGGELAFRFARNNERLQLAALALLYGSLAIFGWGTYLASNATWAFVALGLSAFLGGITNGPMFAATQTLVPPRMRAMSISLMNFFCNLIGMGLGPLAVGALSDALRPEVGRESLRYALLAFCPGYLWCAWHVWLASRTVAADIAIAQVVTAQPTSPVPELLHPKHSQASGSTL